MKKPGAPVSLTRIQANALAAAERRLLTWICRRLPRWVTPDQLTGLALASAILIFAAYAMSMLDPHWLWLAVAAYVLHWFGDSLDGSLARHRKIERPAYGYFIDHSADGFATLLIMIGMGMSPYVRVDVALLAAAGYLLLSVHTFLLARVTDTFRVYQIGMGPTELRIVLIALTILMFFLGPDQDRAGRFSLFDVIVGSGAVVCISVFVIQTIRAGRQLLEHDVPARDVVEKEGM